jgi:predicted nucleic acid-binding protein
MNGTKALLDSNILIYLSKKELHLSFLDRFESVFISVITYLEVLGYNFDDNREYDFVKEIVSLFNVRYIDQKIAEAVVEIRKNMKIKLPDAIIAGTALSDNLCLVTRNIQDFQRIDCSILNPFDVLDARS